jgi:hypothetical protein
MGEVKSYNVSLTFSYTIRTDDVERTKRDYEFPTFPDLIDDDAVEFIDGTETWEEE